MIIAYLIPRFIVRTNPEFLYCAAQETMLRNLQRQVDFQVVNCKGNKEPRIILSTNLNQNLCWCMILEYDMTKRWLS